ncbi:histidine phosphatase family protein [Verrucomicrobium sp. BvORR034]|jgi:phosphohistidine phosphatase|uniref:SixA phosphatase family protein n=1 Tax=Verrucomicrobium sp. BvORR034 TaxID=1396418 RepID=UPI000678DAD6|nr:histidine phosphatase family protein [Verrucomicrobium sp. BvORR034]
MMKYLTLIRHAKSSWDQAGLADHDRPLNERGVRNAPMVARFLARTYLGANGIPAIIPQPDRLVSSTALRARSTAELMQPDLGVGADRTLLDGRVYHAEPRALLQVVREFDDSWNHVIMFGHNPGMSDFADLLLRRRAIDEMPTCAAAVIELPWETWGAASWNQARLIGYVTPKLIEKRFPDGHEPRPMDPPPDFRANDPREGL